jgi:hypothetical protein
MTEEDLRQRMKRANILYSFIRPRSLSVEELEKTGFALAAEAFTQHGYRAARLEEHQALNHW